MRLAVVAARVHARGGGRAAAGHDPPALPRAARGHEGAAARRHGRSGGSRARTREQIFQQLLGFAGYGFPESHAASFALLVYASAWLKRYHPAAFACALLNSQPMGFYAPHTLVEDAQRHGVEVPGAPTCPRAAGRSTAGGAAPGARRGSPGEAARRPGRAPRDPRAAARRGRGDRRGPCGRAVRVARRPRAPGAGLARVARPPRGGGRARRARAGSAQRGVAEPGARDRRGRSLRRRLAAGARAGPAGARARSRRCGRLRDTGLSTRGHPMAVVRPGLASGKVRTARELVAHAGPRAGGGGRHGHRPPAPGDGERHRLREPGGRDRHRQPGGHARCLRALPPVRGSPFLVARGRVERNGLVVNVRVDSMAPLALAPPVGDRARDFH